MSQMPPGQDLPEDADERYRRASALDTSRPSESTREAILTYAAKLAGERADVYQAVSVTAAPSPPRRRVSWRRAATFSGLAVAGLAGLTVLTRWPAVPVAPTARRPAVTAAPSQAMVVSAQRRAPEPDAQSPAAAPRTMLAEQAAADRSAHGASYRALAQAPRVRAALPPAPGTAGDALAGSGPQSALQPAAPAAAARIAGADRTAGLWAAAGRGDLATLRLLLATHMALDGRDPRGQTALLQAVRHGERAAAETLLAAGADPNVPDNEGMTPLGAAQAAAQPAMAQLLRRYGAR
jgi:Ankyrin repeats (3 copies)